MLLRTLWPTQAMNPGQLVVVEDVSILVELTIGISHESSPRKANGLRSCVSQLIIPDIIIPVQTVYSNCIQTGPAPGADAEGGVKHNFAD